MKKYALKEIKAMRYITVQEVKEEIPEAVQGLLTNDQSQEEDVVDDVLEQKIIAAEQELESYVSSRYRIPLKADDGRVPGQVKQHVFVILKYYLYGRREAIHEGLANQYENTIRFLKNVSEGRANIALIDEQGNVKKDGSEPNIEVGGTDRSQFKTFI